jgi:hypothetical protein
MDNETVKPIDTNPAVLNLAKKPVEAAKTAKTAKAKIAKTAKTKTEAKTNGKEAKTTKTNGEAKQTKGGMTTREAAKILKTTPKALRRALRDMDKYDDGVYTRYLLGKADLNALGKILNA